jgi:hypothetical protein
MNSYDSLENVLPEITYDSLENVLSDINVFGNDTFSIITGGIGDFLTIDYFFFLSNTKNLIFISKQSLRLKDLIKFYNSTNHCYSLYFDFDLINKPGFDNSSELLNFFPSLKSIQIINISDFFPLIKQKITKNKFIISNNLIFNQKTDKNIKVKFNLPETYALINPFTEDNRIGCINCNFIHKGIQNNCKLTRNFIGCDYKNIFEFLKKKNIIGVIVSLEPIYIRDEFKDLKIINLSNNKISIIDCIELVKQCNYFFGIDGMLSVVASKLLSSKNIYIKCNNKHGYINKDVYWYPNKDINLQSFINIKY